MQPLINSSSSADTSVVVPSYNHAPFVEECLRSIFKQTLPPQELIVIDDGSSDDSPKVIERVLRECPFACELIVRANRGLSATLNEGLKRSRGRYFAYLGSDDLWLPEFLQFRVALLEARAKAVLAYGHAYIIDEQDRITECTSEWASYQDGNVQRMLLESLAPLSPTVLYRREPLERHGWNEYAKLEDYELYLRLSAEGDFAFDRRVLSVWRQHAYNTSRDLTLMMNERLAAQRRIAGELGISAQELDWFQALSRFRSAEEFMRSGAKTQAIKLMYQNLRAVPSLASVVRMHISLFVPHRVLRWRKRFLRRRAGKRYGSLLQLQ